MPVWSRQGFGGERKRKSQEMEGDWDTHNLERSLADNARTLSLLQMDMEAS